MTSECGHMKISTNGLLGTEASPTFGEMRTNGLSLPQQDRRGLEECWRLRYGGIWEAIRELLGVVEDERLIRSRD